MSETTNTNDANSNNWWEASLSRRDTTKLGVGVAAVAAIAGCKESVKDVEMDAIDAQKKGGWDVGDTGMPLLTTGLPSNNDAMGKPWTSYKSVPKLLAATKPTKTEFASARMPTLEQSLEQPTLASKVKAVSSMQAKETHKQAAALGALIATSENPERALLIVDVPSLHGPAAAAGMAEDVDPVFVYDNWPHPKGIVKSQDTLGSMLYYASELEAKREKRKGRNVASAIILDSKRLNDGKKPPSTNFDNRYFVEMPSAKDLKAKGITTVLYVTKQARKDETDDLNDSMAEYKDEGLKIVSVPLSNFKRDVKAGGDYYYDGDRTRHRHFYTHYPMFLYVSGGRRSWGKPTGSPRVRPPSYAPTRRPTAFTGRKAGGAKGVGRSKPAGFGRVSTKQGKGGKIMGRSGGSVGRSRSGRFGG